MLHYNPQHVSSSTLLIFRRINCIITASGIVTLCKRPYRMPVESGLQYILPYWAMRTAGRADVKVQNILSMGNNITCSRDCKYRTAATLYVYMYPRNVVCLGCEIVSRKEIPVIIWATGTISKSLRQYLSYIPGKHKIKELQKTAILGTAHILREVLM